MMGLAAFLIAALLGYCLVRLWLPNDGGESPWVQAFHACLGIGLGTGFTSCLYLLLVANGAAKPSAMLGVELVALCAAGTVMLRKVAAPADAGAAPPPFAWNSLMALGVAGMLCLLLAGFVTTSDLNPQGGWDAFAIWNLRARFLVHTETWKYAVTALPVGTHMEYPLLLSSAIARGWVYAGVLTPMVPIGMALVFAVALVVLLVAGLSLARGSSIGLLAGVVLLANPALANQASSQYADVPLAFFILAALALAAVGGERSGRARYLSLAGVFAGFAAWTKNEGSLFLVALAAGLFAGAWRRDGWRSAARQTGLYLLGALPGLLLVLWFKMALAPPDPLAGQMTAALGQKLANGGRWSQVAGGFLKQAWEDLPPLVVLAAVCGLLRVRRAGQLCLAPLLAVLVTLAGYFAIFLVTGDDVEWLLATALDRLCLQLWPALLLGVFLVLRRPEDFAIPSVVAGAVAGKPAKGKKGR